MENSSISRGSCLYGLQRWRRRAIIYVFVLVTLLAAVQSYPSQPLPSLADDDSWRSVSREKRAPEDDTEMSGESEETGSGMSSGYQPISCTRLAMVDPYSLVTETLTSLASDCSFPGNSTVFSAREMGAMTDVFTLAASNNEALFIDYFLPGQSYDLTIEAPCNPNCPDLELNLQLTVSPYLSRLLPYGDLLGDSAMSNVDDSAVSVTAHQPVPAFGDCFTQIYVSSNGLVSLNQSLLNWQPIPFPYGSSQVPVLAPYWTDFDFRAISPELTDNKVYYHTHQLPGSQRDKGLLDTASDRVHLLTEDDSFMARWMLKVTWSQATPYYGQDRTNETSTFQLLLVTNFTTTYAIYLYNTTDWISQTQPLVVGYSAADYDNFDNVESNSSLLNLATEEGNSGEVGQWVYDITLDSEVSKGDEECQAWVAVQEQRGDWYSSLPACPCVYEQAVADRRYSFAWGTGDRCAVYVDTTVSATECCYDANTGALLVGLPHGGGYRYHNPITSRNMYDEDDTVTPRRQCCEESSNCELYYRYRASDDCTRYKPVRTGFSWGDPHFESVDGNQFTFNGIGEYVLLRSPMNQLHIQARLTQLTANQATVVTAVVMKNGDSLPVQIEAGSNQLLLFINNAPRALPADQSMLLVTETAVYTESELSTANIDNSQDRIVVQNSNNTLVLSTSSQVVFTVGSQLNFLYTALQLGPGYSISTEGLLGTFNNDPSDDFQLPDGSTIPVDSTEMEIYNNFGVHWRLSQAESLFYYHDGDSYLTYNPSITSFTPTFGLQALATNPALNATANMICGDDYSCRYDIAITGSADIGQSTHDINQMNKKMTSDLNNFPPRITGPQRLFITSNQQAVFQYSATDPNNDIITLSLNSEAASAEGISLSSSGDLTIVLTSLPTVPVYLTATDSTGRSSQLSLSLLLCSCENNGNCSLPNPLAPVPSDNMTRHYRLPCECPSYAGGLYCEVSHRGCDGSPCPEYAVCQNDTSVESGYTCSQCVAGYELDDDSKCVDINECDVIPSPCSQACVNTPGSYTCTCNQGYRLENNECVDIDECLERTDNCDQYCDNHVGGFTCRCEENVFELTGGNTCQGEPCTNAFCPFMCYKFLSSEVTACVCTPGTGGSSCTECGDDEFGFYCDRTCACQNGGTCDAVNGCMCLPGWTGYDCSKDINNQAPQFVDGIPTSLSLPELLPAGSIVANITAIDNDLNQAGMVEYSIATSPHPLPESVSDGTSVFTIDKTTGLIVITQDLDSLPYKDYLLTIVAKDLAVDQPKSSTLLLHIELNSNPLPIPKFSESAYTTTVPENLPESEIVINVTCLEENPINNYYQNLTISILDGNVNGTFQLMGSSLLINNSPDFEKVSQHVLTLECRNHPFNQSDTVEVVIVITNLDDNDFTFNETPYEAEIYENATNGTKIFTVQAIDADIPNATIEYYFNSTSSFQSLFSIDSQTGEIKIDAGMEQPLDREKRDNYTLLIMAVLLENGGISDQTGTSLTIELLDVNDFIPVFSSSVYMVFNLTQTTDQGEVAVLVSAIDKDLNVSGEVEYTIDSNPYFSIDPVTGEVFVNATMLKRGSFLINVTASDKGTPSLSSKALLDIFVRPVPNQIRFNKTMYQFSYPESVPAGTTLGTVSAVVYDVVNGTIETGPAFESLEYAIMSGSDTAPFHLDTETGELILLTALDYEDDMTFTLTLSASLGSHPLINSATVNVILSLSDVNDNRPIFDQNRYSTVLFDSTAVGTQVLDVSAEDLDSGSFGKITYKIEDDFDGPFDINSTSGEIFISSALDSPQDYHFLVEASDGPTFTTTVDVFISVTRQFAVNPLLSRSQYIFDISESSSTGQLVGAVEGLKQGNQSTSDGAMFRIKQPAYGLGMTPVPFVIDATSGSITATASNFNAETRDEYVFYVELYDSTDTSLVYDTAPVIVKITDENDNSPVFSQTGYSAIVPLSTQPGSVLLNISAKDPDAGSNAAISYQILPPILGFHISPQTGSVSVSNSSLIPGDYVLNIVASDSGDPPLNSTVPLHISILPQQNPNLTFSQQSYNATVTENAATGTQIDLPDAISAVANSTLPPGDISYSFAYDVECFSIAGTTGVITVTCDDLDREEQSVYNLPIVAVYSSTDDTARASVVVTIADMNDNSPSFNQQTYSVVIPEDQNSTDPILTVSAVDADSSPHNTVTYSFSTPSSLFSINAQSGDVYYSSDAPSAGDYGLTVVASDGEVSTPDATAVILITISSQDPQVLIFSEQLYTFSIAENSPGNTVIGMLQLLAPSPVDPSNYIGNLDFEIINATVNSIFLVRDSDGALLLINNLLDREAISTHVLHIRASFHDFSVSASAYVRVVVEDVNDNSPVFNQTIYAVIASAMDDVITTVQANDKDISVNAEVSYSIEAGPFVVNSTSGAITANTPPTTGHYLLTVTAEDSGVPPLSGTALVSIIIEVPPPAFINFTQHLYSGQIAENATVGTVVLFVSLLQESSAVQDAVYNMTSNPYFTIGPQGGDITNYVALNKEAFSGAIYNVTASLPYLPSVSATTMVNITVTDINDNRPVFSKSLYTPSYTYGLKGPFNNIQTILVTDADSGMNGEVDLSFGPGGEMFTINTTPTKIFVTPVSTTVPAGYYHFIVEATDRGVPPLSSTATFLVTVYIAVPSDIHFQPPSLFIAAENVVPGTSLGSVSLQGPLDTSLIHSIRYNTSVPNHFVILSQGSVDTTVSVVSVAPLDYDTMPQHMFKVFAELTWITGTTTTTRVASVVVTLNLTDVNDNAPVFQLPTFSSYFTASVAENSPQSVSIIIPPVSDADTGVNAQLSFLLPNTYGGRFKILPSTGEIQTGTTQLDREAQSSYILTVVAADHGFPPRSGSATVRVNVNDQNDNRPTLISGNVYTITESQPVGTVAFTVRGTDPDLGFSGTVRYFLGAGSPPMFSIPNPSVGNVVIAQLIDSDGDNPNSYSFTLILRDIGFPPLETAAFITVNVLDVPNDNPPIFNTDLGTGPILISPTIATGEQVLTINAYDIDPQDTVTYSIASVTPPQFSIGLFEINPTTGVITKGASDTLQPGDTIDVTVQARDSSPYHLTSTLQLTIQVLNQFSFTQLQYHVSILENSTTGVVVSTLQLVDSQLVSETTFELQPQSVPFVLNKRENEVDIILTSVLDREQAPSYTFTVIGRLESSEGMTEVIVTVIDVNDNGPAFTDQKQELSVSVQSAIGDIVGKVNASDSDTGLNGELTYTLAENPFFRINSSTGVIFVSGSLATADGPVTITVEAHDGGNPPQSVQATYTVNIMGTGGDTDGGLIVVSIMFTITLFILIIMIVLVIVMFVTRRKDDKTKSKKPQDPYANWALKPSSQPQSATELLENDFQIDTAYETMQEEETMIDQENMPWFNPAYQAAEPNKEKAKPLPPESIDTDEPHSDYTMSQQGSSLLSSVDSPMKYSKGRRVSSVADSSASESIIEENAGYLESYQETKPMKPGERGHEFDIFAKEDTSRPRRASIRDYNWQYEGEQAAAASARAPISLDLFTNNTVTEELATTRQPVTKSPVTNQPVAANDTKTPVSKEAVPKTPISDKPSMKKSVAATKTPESTNKTPVSKEAVPKTPNSEKPAMKKSVAATKAAESTNKPVSKEATPEQITKTKQPVTNEPVTKLPVTNESVSKPSVTNTPVAKKTASKELATTSKAASESAVKPLLQKSNEKVTKPSSTETKAPLASDPSTSKTQSDTKPSQASPTDIKKSSITKSTTSSVTQKPSQVSVATADSQSTEQPAEPGTGETAEKPVVRKPRSAKPRATKKKTSRPPSTTSVTGEESKEPKTSQPSTEDPTSPAAKLNTSATSIGSSIDGLDTTELISEDSTAKIVTKKRVKKPGAKKTGVKKSASKRSVKKSATEESLESKSPEEPIVDATAE